MKFQKLSSFQSLPETCFEYQHWDEMNWVTITALFGLVSIAVINIVTLFYL